MEEFGSFSDHNIAFQPCVVRVPHYTGALDVTILQLMTFVKNK